MGCARGLNLVLNPLDLLQQLGLHLYVFIQPFCKHVVLFELFLVHGLQLWDHVVFVLTGGLAVVGLLHYPLLLPQYYGSLQYHAGLGMLLLYRQQLLQRSVNLQQVLLFYL